MIRFILCSFICMILLSGCKVDVTPNDSQAYIKFVGSSRDENIKNIQPTSDGGFILVGSTTSFREKRQDLDFYIAKVDQNGDKQWQRHWGLKLADEANSVMEMPNGAFWVLGYSADTLDTAGERTDFALHICSANGDSLQTHYFKTPNISGKGKYITKISDSMFLLVGNITQPEEPAGNSSNMRAYQIDANFKLINSYPVGSLGTEDALMGIIKDSDNLLWIGNIKRKFLNNIPNRIRVAITDISGNPSDDYIFRELEGTANNDEVGQVIYRSDLQTYVVVGTSSELSGSSKDVCLLKFSISGKLLDDTSINFKKIEKNGEEEGKGIYPTSDGGFIIVGTKFVKNEDTDIYLLKIDAEGNEQWSKTFGGSGIDEGVAVRETADGGFLIVTNVWFKNNKVVGLYKTDSQGNIFK